MHRHSHVVSMKVTRAVVGMDVHIGSGTVRGEERDGVRTFKGIPYAAPPVGELRFAPSQPPLPWSGTRDATEFAQPSLQPTLSVDGQLLSADPNMLAGREDCLYVNVDAPAEPGPHPVLVWIHGGGAVMGTPNDFDGSAFARDGVVVVSIAYRLGALGMLYLPDVFEDGAGCNLALQDQIAALRWVRDNFAAFGGDPDRVTVAGSSNGGRVVGCLMAAPPARGLFHQAVPQSGTGVGYAVATPDEALGVTSAVLAELGLELSQAELLRKVPTQEIVLAQARVSRSWPTLLPFQVVLDDSIMPRRPVEAVAEGAARDVRLLIGTAHDEQEGFAMSESDIAANTSGNSVMVGGETLRLARSAYRCLVPDDWTEEEVQRHVITSADWWVPAIRMAEAHSRAGGTAWMYRLDWRLGPRGQGYGALHGLDVPLISGDLTNPAYAETVALAAGGPDRMREMARTMHDAWVRFIRDGHPGENAESWPAYEPATRSTCIFDDVSAAADDPDRELRVIWDGLV